MRGEVGTPYLEHINLTTSELCIIVLGFLLVSKIININKNLLSRGDFHAYIMTGEIDQFVFAVVCVTDSKLKTGKERRGG